MAPNKDIDMAEILIISIKGSSKGTTNQILLLIVKVGPSLNKGPTPLDNPLGPPLPTQIPIKLSPVNITKGWKRAIKNFIECSKNMKVMSLDT